MRKLILSLCMLMFSLPVVAGSFHHGHRHHHYRHWVAPAPSIHHWVVPALIGGAVVYAATRPDPVIIQQPAPVVVNNQYVVIDGVTYKKEIIILNGIQQEVLVRQ